MNQIKPWDLRMAASHPISKTGRDSIEIGGFYFSPYSNVFGQITYGNHFLSSGIADGSLLLCTQDAEIVDGDLVLLSGYPQEVCRYLSDPNAISDGTERVTHSADRVYAKIIAAFNFYL